MSEFFVMWNGSAWFVKEGTFFRQQGGLVQSWGFKWRPLYADTIEHARDKARLEFGVNGERFFDAALAQPEEQL